MLSRLASINGFITLPLNTYRPPTLSINGQIRTLFYLGVRGKHLAVFMTLTAVVSYNVYAVLSIWPPSYNDIG